MANTHALILSGIDHNELPYKIISACFTFDRVSIPIIVHYFLTLL